MKGTQRLHDAGHESLLDAFTRGLSRDRPE
jgi:hypothetical protein